MSTMMIRGNVRTRFAPSPTGELHIGGARTALFNFLFARGAKGRFILRLDDTDIERSRVEYEKKLEEDLRWLGIEWDEGPDMGLAVPYRQSERGCFYEEILRALRARRAVYPCFCSEERLAALRRAQLEKGEAPRYDGACRRLSPEEVSRRVATGTVPCLRFALPEKPIAFHDAVRGDLSFAPGIMGDFIVARSDGLPTYLFTSAVDDRLMEISHVIRGDEHIPNTARQLAVLDALEWPAPVFAHVPMILSPDRQKLGKRTGSTPIRQYRREGCLPEALCAYLATLSWTPPEDVSLFSLEQLASAFSLDRVSSSSPVHDEAHLRHRQKEAMKRRGSAFLLDRLTEEDPRFRAFDPSALRSLIDDLVEEYCTLPLLREALDVLFVRPSPESGEAFSQPWIPDLGQALREVGSWDDETELNGILRAFMKNHALRGKDFFHPLRLALTGKESGAALTLLMRALGREETLARLTK